MGNLRISGLASGIDTDSMVESLMKVERLKVTRVEQNKQIALWKQEAYTNMNKLFANFILNTKKNIGLTKTTSTGITLNTSYKSADYLKKATSSNENVATISNTSKAINGSFTIDVKELAKEARITSSKLSSNEKFGTILEIKLSESGDIIKVENSNGITMKDIAKAINDAKQGVTASFEVDSYGNGALILQTTATGKDAKIDLQLVTGDSNFIDQFETTSKIGDDALVIFNGVEMEYSTNSINLNGLNIQLKNIGKTTINVSTNVDGIMEKIEQLVNDYNELIDKVSTVVNEKRYSNYHPLSQEEKKSMHEDDVKLWEEKAKSGMLSNDEIITRTLQSIRLSLYEKVEGLDGSFDTLFKIGITTQSYTRGVTGGKLQIDKEKLRQAIENDPEGVMELLFKESPDLAGKPTRPIEPVKADDETEDDFQQRMAKYNEELKRYNEDLRQYERNNKKYKHSNNGIFTRIYDNLIDGMKSIIDKSGPGQDSELLRNVKSNILIDFVTTKSSKSDIDREISNYSRKIDDLNAMLLRKENVYYAKFANMEKMLQQMYSQSNWLSQQFAR